MGGSLGVNNKTKQNLTPPPPPSWLVRQTPLEEAMSAAEAERVGAVKRLTRKDGDLLTVRKERPVAAAAAAAVGGPSTFV